METGKIAIVSCNNNHSGRNKGEEKRNWALGTLLTGADNSKPLCH